MIRQLLSLLVISLLVSCSTDTHYLKYSEGIKHHQLTFLVSLPLYSVPLQENDTFMKQVRSMADNRAQVILAHYYHVTTENLTREKLDCYRQILKTAAIIHSGCDDSFCYWWYRYSLKGCSLSDENE